MDRLAELQTRRKELAQKIETHRRTFNAAGNKWQSEELRTAWQNDIDAWDLVQQEIKELRGVLNTHTKPGKKNRRSGDLPSSQRMPGQDDPSNSRDENEPRKLRGKHLFRTESGRMIRTFAPKDRLVRRGERENVGKCLRALLLNRHDDLNDSERRAVIGGVDSSGGYLLNPSLSLSIVDLARSASRVIEAGAQTIPMDAAEMNIVRVTADPTTQWRPELVAVAGSSPAFDRVVMRARTVAAIIPVSIEQMEDATNLPQILEMVLRAALGQALDRAALRGTGAANEPKGIRNHADVNTVATVGTPTDYSKFSQAVGEVLTDNYDGDPSSLAWLLHPRDGIILDKLEDSTGQPLNPTPWVSKLQRFSTTQLSITEGAGAESHSVIGDFSQVVIGMRTSGVQIRVLSSGSVVDADGQTVNVASQLGVLIVAYMRCDVAIIRPTWLCNLTGITIT